MNEQSTYSITEGGACEPNESVCISIINIRMRFEWSGSRMNTRWARLSSRDMEVLSCVIGSSRQPAWLLPSSILRLAGCRSRVSHSKTMLELGLRWTRTVSADTLRQLSLVDRAMPNSVFDGCRLQNLNALACRCRSGFVRFTRTLLQVSQHFGDQAKCWSDTIQREPREVPMVVWYWILGRTRPRKPQLSHEVTQSYCITASATFLLKVPQLRLRFNHNCAIDCNTTILIYD